MATETMGVGILEILVLAATATPISALETGVLKPTRGRYTDDLSPELPSELEDASRYQIYLYEIGEIFDRNGMKTIYPVSGSDAEGDYRRIRPDGEDLPIDGEPDSDVASNGAARRVVEIAVLQCVADSVRGRGTYPTYGKYIEVFVTEEAGGSPNSQIWGELIGPLTPSNSEHFRANAQMSE